MTKIDGNFFNILQQEKTDCDSLIPDDTDKKLKAGLNGGKLLEKGDTIIIYPYKNPAGKIKSTTDLNEKTAYDIFNQIQGWSLNSNTIKLLDKINEKNALQILDYYNGISPQESLSEAVLNEWGLDIDTVKKYICKPLVEQAKSMGLENIDDSSYLNIKDEVGIARFVKSLQGQMRAFSDAQTKTAQKAEQASAAEKTSHSAVYNEDNTPKTKVNPDDFSVEALKKVYPPDKYEINHSTYEGITIVDKSTGKIIRRIHHDRDFMTIEDYDEKGRSKYWGLYNLNGELQYYDLNGKRYFPLVDALYDDIYAKNALGLPTTGKTLEENVKKITPENILDILRAYEEKSDGESLVDAIMSERGLSPEKRAELVKYIKDVLVQYAKNKGVYTDDIDNRLDRNINYEKRKVGPMSGKHIDYLMKRLITRASCYSSPDNKPANGQIDGDFKQGQTGDCWLVAAIKAAADNPQARKMLDDLVSVDDKGNVTVHLKGVNKTYVITKEELEGANELSSGDMDVRAIEIAVNRYFEEEYEHSWNPHRKNDIDKGGQSQMAFQILFGKGGKSFLAESFWGSLYDALFNVNDSLIKKIKSGKAIVVVSVTEALKVSDLKDAYDADGDPVQLIGSHAYSVIDADEEYVYLVNPHDSSKVIKMRIEDFKDTFNSADVLELDD